jgi:hypothetical protein
MVMELKTGTVPIGQAVMRILVIIDITFQMEVVSIKNFSLLIFINES